MSFATLARENETASPSAASAFSKSRFHGLRLGEPDSSFEREADRVADQVMAGEAARVDWSLSNMRIDAGAQRKCACGGSAGCTKCAENKTVQCKYAGNAHPLEAPSIVNEVLGSPGAPLDRATRNFFEPRFAHDFSRVRVYADTPAANTARALDARAYTVGNDLVFGRGQYAPYSEAGRKLLAHELAHTVQQSRIGAAEGKLLRRKPNDAAPSSAEQQLSKDIHAAAIEAARKVHEKGLDKLPEHIPTAPEPRPAPETPKPTEAAADKPKEVAPATPLATPKGPQPDPGSRERQLAVGGAAQSGPAQVGGVVQGAFQDKNYVPGIAVDFLKYFHLQLGVLQPTYTLQLTHLKPTQGGAGSSASPLPPPDTAQFSATFSPAVVKVGALTIAPQVGLATAVGGDVFGTTKGPGKSGTHGQALGVISLQLDYSLTKRLSLTGAVGAQGGLDVDLGTRQATGTGNVNGSVVATFHF